MGIIFLGLLAMALFSLLFFGLSFVIVMVVQAMVTSKTIFIIMAIILAIASILFLVVLLAVMSLLSAFTVSFQYQFLINIATGRDKTIKETFEEVKNFSLVREFFVGTIAYVLVVLGGMILLIVPGIIWGIKYCFVPWLILDKKMKVGEAFTASAEMTKNNKMKILIFGLLVGLISIIPYLLVGDLILTPIYLFINIYLYLFFAQKITRLAKPAKNYSLTAVVAMIVIAIVINILGMMINVKNEQKQEGAKIQVQETLSQISDEKEDNLDKEGGDNLLENFNE